MPDQKRLYRKKLSSHGLIFIGGEELEVLVRNLSVSGVLAELDNCSIVNNITDVFQLLKDSSLIDLYIPDMRLAGEAEVVRADMVSNHIYLGLEFTNISYDVDNLLYKRHSYRKNLSSPGQIILNGKKYIFKTENVSVDGLMIRLQETVSVDVGMITIFDFKQLELRGEIQVAWVEQVKDGGTLMGLKYLHMEKERLKGIPSFSSAYS